MASISTLIDRVKIFVLSSGTGPFQLGSAVPAYRGIEALADGGTYSYAVESGSTYETGTFTYVSSTNTAIRTPVLSSNGGAAVAFPAGVQLVLTALAQDLVSTGGTFPIIDSLGNNPTVAPSQRVVTVAITALLASVAACATTAALAANSGATMIGWQLSTPGSTPRTAADKFGEMVSIKDLGVLGDGSIEESAAIDAAVNGPVRNIRFVEGLYNIDQCDWSANNKNFTFDAGAVFYGVATTARDAIIKFTNLRNCRFNGSMTIETDGNAATPVFMPNYGCALQITSTSSPGPSQFIQIEGLQIRYIKNGIVNGALFGQPPQASIAQSEIFIRDYRQRGVLRPYYGNATNSYITFGNSIFVPQQFEASSWWNDADGWCIRNDIGEVMSIGDEFQRAAQTGYCLYGKGITVIGAIWEHSCPNYVTGDMAILDTANGFFGSNINVPFIIDPAATGLLYLRNADLRRPNGTASSSRSLFVDCKGNNNFEIEIVSTKLKEWAYQTNAGNAHFVLGGKALFRDVELDNSASTQPSWNLNMERDPIRVFDTTGATMSTTPDQTAKGGWTITGAPAGGTFNKSTADLPAGATSAITFKTTGTSMTVTTPTGAAAHPVVPGTDYILRMALKGTGATVTNFSINVIWYNFAGVAIGSPVTVYAADKTRMTATGFDAWQELRVPATAPVDAVYAAVQTVCGSTAEVAITGVRFE